MDDQGKPMSDLECVVSCNKMSIDSDDSGSISSKSSITTKKTTTRSGYNFRERRVVHPEKRSVNRKKSSLLPKSKALLRVIDQADEDTRLEDLEMRREHETTTQLNNSNSAQQHVPAASWTKVTDNMPSYQCSKLNPEIEMTNFQLENISSYKTIKRKASEDRFEPYPISINLKRRAVSPSSPPTTHFLIYGSSNNNAAGARAASILYDASGGLSRMSLNE